MPSPSWAGRAGASARAEADRLEAEAARWRRGADGEELVGGLLNRLPAGEWWTFHDVPLDRSGVQVDHLVIGVGGVFTVNTKHLRGDVWAAPRALLVAGRRTDYYPKAIAEARRVAERLADPLQRAIPVLPVLAVITPRLTVKEQPADLRVLDGHTVATWLCARDPVLTPHAAHGIALAAHACFRA